MGILTHKCPHCLTEHIALNILASTEIANQQAVLHLRCPKCDWPAAAILVPNPPHSLTVGGSGLAGQTGDAVNYGWKIKEFWPNLPAPNIPHYIPPDVERVYLQAERNFPVSGNEEAAGTMYRKALDIGFKKIDPSLSGMLGPRIKKLAAVGRLTDDIAIWSDTVRDVGNDAAHEESPITRDELTELRNFTEMVLRYLFSLPNAVKKRRGEKLDWEDDPTPAPTA